MMTKRVRRTWSRFYNRRRQHRKSCPPMDAKAGGLRGLSGPAECPELRLADLWTVDCEAGRLPFQFVLRSNLHNRSGCTCKLCPTVQTTQQPKSRLMRSFNFETRLKGQFRRNGCEFIRLASDPYVNCANTPRWVAASAGSHFRLDRLVCLSAAPVASPRDTPALDTGCFEINRTLIANGSSRRENGSQSVSWFSRFSSKEVQPW